MMVGLVCADAIARMRCVSCGVTMTQGERDRGAHLSDGRPIHHGACLQKVAEELQAAWDRDPTLRTLEILVPKFSPEPSWAGMVWMGKSTKPPSGRCGCPPGRHVGRLQYWSGAHHVTACCLYESIA